MQSRLNSWLALGVMLLVGGGFLTWYYTRIAQNQKEAVRQLDQQRAGKVSAEMKLPPLGPVDAPPGIAVNMVSAADAGPTALGDVLGPAPAVPSQESTPSAQPGLPQQASQYQPTPEDLALQRRLAQPVLYRQNLQVSQLGAGVSGAGQRPDIAAGDFGAVASGQQAAPSAPGSIGPYLRATATPAARAQVLATMRFVLPKGSFVDCTLETALDSQLPGMTTCITAYDTFSADGRVVLLERGSKLVGETRGEAHQGMNRVFVLWTEARTPTGVVVPLASPGTDELGRSGLAGFVDTHFWQRFGAAILLSVIDGAFQYAIAAQSKASGGSATIYNSQGSQNVLTEVLRNTISIPPTIVKNQGDRIQVFVARDLDFRSVYELAARQ